jgi:predicted heme/steroid binding protein
MILLEGNVYRLPDGKEFVPGQPTGTLGRIEHIYALLTMEQHEKGQRGSVYIRTDGRIFDYSFDQAHPDREIFDTGYTIQDLERTGRYASCRNQLRSV